MTAIAVTIVTVQLRQGPAKRQASHTLDARNEKVDPEDVEEPEIDSTEIVCPLPMSAVMRQQSKDPAGRRKKRREERLCWLQACRECLYNSFKYII